MTTILYIVPYFGKFPRLFPVWLHSCANNPTVNWLILTDDKRDVTTQHPYRKLLVNKA